MVNLWKKSGIVFAAVAGMLFASGTVLLTPGAAKADEVQCIVFNGEGEGTVVSVESDDDCIDAGGLLIEG